MRKDIFTTEVKYGHDKDKANAAYSRLLSVKMDQRKIPTDNPDQFVKVLNVDISETAPYVVRMEGVRCSE